MNLPNDKKLCRLHLKVSQGRKIEKIFTKIVIGNLEKS